MKDEIIIFSYSNQPQLKIEVRIEDETVWLTQAKIAELFGVKRPAITKHLKNIFISGELDEDSTCSILEHMGVDSKQKYRTKYYNLDVILSVGYRVNSINATQFRIWANKILKEYLLRGHVVNHRLGRIEEEVQHIKGRINDIEFKIQTNLPPNEGIFFNGQIFDAWLFVIALVKDAKKSIVLIDNYIDESVLSLLSKRNPKVDASIYTAKISPSFKLDLEKHNHQYKPVQVKVFSQSHDRFLIIDDSTVYHIGASLKDLGKKWFAFSKIKLDPKDLLKRL
ncbi:MAG: virulence RhuM family protein [Bacteroidales bacterium]|nr:virulence RhuM family protein [Bacteroidales bacterium]